MTREENIKAILNAHFTGFKDEIIDSATNTICELKQEPFMSKPCISAGVCEHDKMQVLDKVRKEIKDWQIDIHDNEYDADKHDFVFERIFEIIDECKAESEG